MIYTDKDLQAYLKNDWILDMLKHEEDELNKDFRSHVWLTEMPNKRMIYADIYGEYLQNKSDTRVLDVGGGFSSLTSVLARNCDYTLIDFFAHDEKEKIRKLRTRYDKDFLLDVEWSSQTPKDYDVVIANDIFPDVDQRMEMFIETYLPHCKEMRLLVTFYNDPKWYLTRRIDDTEMLTFLSWDGEITVLKLGKYSDRLNISRSEFEQIKTTNESIYRNGRQVAYVKLKGNL